MIRVVSHRYSIPVIVVARTEERNEIECFRIVRFFFIKEPAPRSCPTRDNNSSDVRIVRFFYKSPRQGPVQHVIIILQMSEL